MKKGECLDLGQVCAECAAKLAALQASSSPHVFLAQVGFTLRWCPTCEQLGKLCLATSMRARDDTLRAKWSKGKAP